MLLIVNTISVIAVLLSWPARGASAALSHSRDRGGKPSRIGQSNPLSCGVWRQRGQARTMYRNFQAFTDAVAPLRSLAGMAAAALMPAPPDASRPDTSRTDISRPDPSQNAVQRAVAALCELIARAGLSHRRPAFGIDQVEVAGRPVAVREVAVHRTPFCTLLRFEKELAAAQPQGAAGGADVGAFRHPACAARCARCWPSTTSTSPTGTTPATSACATAILISTTSSSTSSPFSKCWVPARIWSRSASPASPHWRQSRSWPRTAIRRSRAA